MEEIPSWKDNSQEVPAFNGIRRFINVFITATISPYPDSN
jgi:hypothetical protein